MTVFDVLIVGGGHGGAHTAIALRKAGFSGTVAIVSAENDPPYERPPLSKEYLSGDRGFERLLIRPAAFWEENGITLISGTRIETVDADLRVVATASGEQFGFGVLVWATGGEPRILACAGGRLPGVHAIRSRADVDSLARDLATAREVVVIGGGYIGLEAAAVLNKLEKSVSVLEAQDRVLARAAGPDVSRFLEAEHRRRGVAVHLDAAVAFIEERHGRAAVVVLEDGRRFPADVVIAGIGIEPAIQPLIAAGAAGGNGVQVDGQCRTSLKDIYAVGDCAQHVNVYAEGRSIRLESVQNAHDQAAIAARAILGETVTYTALPWFWSNQYDLKIQTVGLSSGYDQVVIRGDPATRSFSAVYLSAGRVIALDCVNAVRDYVQGRILIEGRIAPDLHRLADGDIPLKTLA